MTNKSRGHAYVILFLCKKSGVKEFTYGRIMNSTWTLDDVWIIDHPERARRTEEVPATKENPAETIGPIIPQP